MQVIKKIKVFGDSILKGIQLNPENMKYYVENNIDIDLISEKYSFNIENHSKFGCTITKGYSLIKKHLEAGANCDLMLMDYGGNDCDYNWKEVSERPDEEHFPKTPLNVFADTYRKMIDLLKEKGIRPILTNLPPLDAERFFNWFCGRFNKKNILNWLGDVGAIYRHQESYSEMIEEIARETGVALVDLRGAFLDHGNVSELLSEDGTHPNTEGQKVMTAAFLDFAEKMTAA